MLISVWVSAPRTTGHIPGQAVSVSGRVRIAAAVAKAAKNSENITSLHYRVSGTVGGDGRLEVRFVDGVMYKGTVDVDSLRGERLDQIFGPEASGPLTTDLWIDGDDRTKQFRFQAGHLDLLTGTEDGRLELTVNFPDINRPVTIKAPPAEDTTPLAAGTAQD